MDILIIGGTGILSTSVVNECVEKQHCVTMLNRGHRKAFINPTVELIKCDINKPEQVKELLKGRRFDTVVDFICYTEEQVVKSVSLFGKLAKQYVFISSAQVYNTSIDTVLDEDSEMPQPLWNYSTNKYKAEQKVKEMCSHIGVSYTIVRPGVNYDNRRIPYGIYPPMGQHWTICNRIIHDKPIITWNNGENRLNLTRTEDFACGLVGLLGNSLAYNEAFNVVGDYVYSWKEVLDAIGRYLGRPIKTIDIPVDFYVNELDEVDKQALRGGRSNNLVCSNAKLRNVFPDFQSKYDLDSGIKKTLDYYKNNNYLDGYSYRYDAETDRIINKYLKSIGKEPMKLNYASFGNIEKKAQILNPIKYRIIKNKENPIISFIISHK